MRDYFEIRAEAITVHGSNGIEYITVFNPDAATREKLASLKMGDDLGLLKLIDKFDDGTEDVHIGTHNMQCVGTTSSGDSRKTKVIALIVKNIWQMG